MVVAGECSGWVLQGKESGLAEKEERYTMDKGDREEKEV